MDAIYNHCAAELESRSLLSGRKSFGQPSFTFEEAVCGAGGGGCCLWERKDGNGDC